MRHVPIAVLTAKDGRNIRQLVNLTQSMYKQARTRISTGKLNRALKIAIEKNTPPHRKNRRPKIYYASQVAIAQPTIVVKCNEPELFDESWKRYLLGFLREVSPFQEVPIRMIMRDRGDSEESLNLPDIELRTNVSDEDFRNDFPDDEMFDSGEFDDEEDDDDDEYSQEELNGGNFLDDDDDDDEYRRLRFEDFPDQPDDEPKPD